MVGTRTMNNDYKKGIRLGIYKERRNRFELFEEVNGICRDLAYMQTGNKKPYVFQINAIKKFWINFFGFVSLQEMNLEDLENFKSLLQAKVEAEYKLKAFPIFHGNL